MIHVSKSTMSRCAVAALAGVLAFVSPSPAQASECTQQWGAITTFLGEFANIDDFPPVIARSMADGGCRVSGIELPFDRRTKLTIRTLTWSGDDLDRVVSQGLPPRAVNIAIESIRRKSTFGIPEVDRDIDQFLAKLDADLNLVAHWNEDTRQASLDLLSIRMQQGDYLTARAIADNVDFGSKAKMQMSAGGFSIPSVWVQFETIGTFEKLLTDPFGSSLWGRSEDRAERVEMMEGNVDLLPDAFAPPASKAAIKAFFKDTPKPKGAVRIEINASAGLGPVRFLPYVSGIPINGQTGDFWSMLQGVQVKVIYPAD